MGEPLVSILIPSVDRPDKLVRCLDAVIETIHDHNIEIVCSVSSEDVKTARLLQDYPVKITSQHVGLTGAVIAWNEAACVAAGDIFAMIGDDVIVQPGWLDIALTKLAELNYCGVVGLNDLSREDGAVFSTHIITSRDYLVYFNCGVLLVPHYVHYMPDVELCARARKLKRYVFAPDAVIDHRSVAHKQDRISSDPVYCWAYQYWTHDTETYGQRKAAGFPNDYVPQFGHNAKRLVSEQVAAQVGARQAKRLQPQYAPNIPGQVQSLRNPIELRYLGAHRVTALFTDAPSGHRYRIRLKAHQEFYVDSADADWFCDKRDANGAAEFEEA